MIVFTTDLDNTMIFSYKHDIGENKICAEVYQGREISFVTEKTADLLKKVNETVLLVPTTTRTLEQYNRIDLGIGTPRIALVCNGGVLLENGKENDEWYGESLRLTETARDQLHLSEKLLEEDKNRTFEIRNIRELFVFTKCDEPEKSVSALKEKLDTDIVDVFNNGVKVYVVPKALSKGKALERLRQKLSPDVLIAAGDSEFDITMLHACDIPIAPRTLADTSELPDNTVVIDEDDGIFSDRVLECVLSMAKRYSSN